MKFYGDTDDANTGGGKTYAAPTADPYGFDAVSSAPAGDDGADTGKGSVSFSDPLGSVADTVGAFGDFLGGIGQIGIPGGPNLGGVAGAVTAPARFGLEVAGNALGAVGSIPLPYLGNDPTKTNANLGQVPGVLGDVISASGRFLEGEAAKGRLTGDAGGTDLLGEVGRFLLGSQTDKIEAAVEQMTREGKPVPPQLIALLSQQRALNDAALPPDIQARLDAGEDVDALANEMVERGIGYTNDPGANLLASVVLDPLNLLSFGAGKAATIGKNADRALAAGKTLGVGEAFMGKAYGAASRGLSAGGQALMDHTIGPATSGVFHALGTRPYNAVKNAAANIGRPYGQAFEEAFALGAAQMPRAVIARYLAEDATASIKAAVQRAAQAGEDVVDAGRRALGAQTDDIEGSITARISAQRTIGNGQLERRTEELLRRTAPDFLGHTDEGRFIESRDKLAQITGMSAEDAARALGGKADVRTAQTIHMAFYGKAGDDLARAKASAVGAKNIDPERLTLVGSDTLTNERAKDILDGKADLVSAVDQFSILRNRFGNTAFDHAKVTQFIQKLVDEDALTHAVLAPVTGKNKLPPALKDWQRTYEQHGYTIGFAPKDGWKTVIDEDGNVLYADPFTHFTSDADPLTQRNPLGRFMDSLLRGSTQTTIIAQSKARMVRITRPGGLSANEARTIHQKILQTAADEGVSPRGLSLRGSHVYEDVFREVLGKERYDQFIQKVEPNFAVMWAFRGELGTVGLTQGLTGAIKTEASGRGNIFAAITEGIYPIFRFRLSPLFQLQELTESAFFNLLRGVSKRNVSPEVRAVYDELADLPDFQYLAEAGYTLNIAGANEVARTMTAQNTLLGKALSRFPNVRAFKERQRVSQVFHEHGEAFEEAVNAINPKLWATMTEHYGITDARQIAEAFIQERMALASGDIDEAMAVFDAAKPVINGHDMETVWQAFRESFRATSEQAFKTHYFSPTRGFLERTVNHPYLGIYPASYMWGKVLPELARFLVKRPFGLNAPLVGLAAYQRVQQTLVAQLAMDPELNEWVESSSKTGSLYLIAQLLPATPDNIPANAPAWARHLSNDLSDGKKIDPQRFAQREAKDTLSNATGPLKTFNVTTGALGDLGDIFSRLTNAAAQLDAQYPRR